MGDKLIDLTGKTFGHWTVIRRAPNKGKRVFWLCRCVCGTEKIVQGTSLKNGVSKSCGCKKSENHFETHGLSNTDLYRKWLSIKNRCYNQKDKKYKNYGGRGIKVCDEWLNDFEAFYTWSLSHGYEKGLEIDRIDNNGNYEPDNCRYTTRRENMLNRNNTIKIKFRGEEKPLLKWCEELNLPYGTIYSRIYDYGWSTDKALSAPINKGE